MRHLSDDQLLLHAYGDAPDGERSGFDQHLGDCAECRERFARIEESRVALEWGLERQPAQRLRRRLIWMALPLAAGIGALLLLRQPIDPAPAETRATWRSHLVGSSTAGYVAGGAAFISIDSQLTRLEQGRSYGSFRN